MYRWKVDNVKKLVIVLAAAVAVSGCTALQDGGREEEGQGVDLDTRLSNTEIAASGTTHLSVELENRNLAPLEDVKVRVLNTNGLELTREIGSGAESFSCWLRVPRSEAIPQTKQCLWSIEPGGEIDKRLESREEVTVPLTVSVSYTSRLSPLADSLKPRFRSDDDLDRSGIEQTLSVDNGDISLEASHSSPVSATTGTVPVELSVKNTGSGRLGNVAGDEGRTVKVFYTGSLMELGMDPSTTSCTEPGKGYRTLRFVEGRQRTSMDCQFSLTADSQDILDRDFTLRPVVEYRYTRTQNHPLTVYSRG